MENQTVDSNQHVSDKTTHTPNFWRVSTIILFFLLLIIGVAYIFNAQIQKPITISSQQIDTLPQKQIIPTTTSTLLDSIVEDKQQTQTNGFIGGSVGYPSEGLPANMEVCAVNSYKKEFCTKPDLKNVIYEYGENYRLEIPIGNYYVFARALSGKYKAYHTSESHKPIVVKVVVGKKIQNINPNDFQEYFEDSDILPVQ